MHSSQRPSFSTAPSPGGVLLTVIAFLVAACVVGVFVLALALPMVGHLPSTHEARRTSRTTPLPMMQFTRNEITEPARNRQINLYIDSCLNRVSREILESRRVYLGSTRGVSSPAGLRSEEVMLYEVRLDDAVCEQGIRRATSFGPVDPALEAAGQRYLQAGRATAATINDATPYYRNRDWQDDGMARGRALHPAILAAFESFYQAHLALADLVEAAQRDGGPAACVARSDDSFACQITRHQALARQATMTALRATPGPTGAIAGLDLPGFAAAIATLEVSVRSLSAEAERGHAFAGSFMPDDYAREAEDHLRALKSLYRSARDHRSVDVDAWNTPGLDPDGSPARIVSSFNQTVRDFNLLE